MKRDSIPGLCESCPDRTSYPNRESTDAPIEAYRQQGIPVWTEKCKACGGWHIFVAHEVYESKLRKP